MDELAMRLEEMGLGIISFWPHYIYVDDFMVSIEYVEEHNVYLIEKKDDTDIFEVDTPVEEMIDWMRQMEEFSMLVYADKEESMKIYFYKTDDNDTYYLPSKIKPGDSDTQFVWKKGVGNMRWVFFK